MSSLDDIPDAPDFCPPASLPPVLPLVKPDLHPPPYQSPIHRAQQHQRRLNIRSTRSPSSCLQLWKQSFSPLSNFTESQSYPTSPETFFCAFSKSFDFSSFSPRAPSLPPPSGAPLSAKTPPPPTPLDPPTTTKISPPRLPTAAAIGQQQSREPLPDLTGTTNDTTSRDNTSSPPPPNFSPPPSSKIVMKKKTDLLHLLPQIFLRLFLISLGQQMTPETTLLLHHHQISLHHQVQRIVNKKRKREKKKIDLLPLLLLIFLRLSLISIFTTFHFHWPLKILILMVQQLILS